MDRIKALAKLNPKEEQMAVFLESLGSQRVAFTKMIEAAARSLANQVEMIHRLGGGQNTPKEATETEENGGTLL